MRDKSYIFCIILFFFIVSCNKRNDEIKETFLKNEVIFFLDNMYIPRDICCIDSFLIIGDRSSSEMYSIFEREENRLRLVTTFGKRGEGPNEFLFPETMKMVGENITIFDRSLIKMKEVSIPLSVDENLDRNESIRSKLFVGLNNLIKMNDSLFVGLTYLDKTRLAIISDDSLHSVSIPYPDDGIIAPMRQKSLVYQGTLLRHPFVDKFVFASLYGKIFEIYKLDREKNEMYRIVSKNEIFPQYVPIDDKKEIEAKFSKNNITGYLHASVTERFIYLLYSGKTVKDSKKNFSSQIDVYKWDGEFVVRLMLDQSLSGFCVTPKDDLIYGITYDEENEKSMVLCYKLDI